MMPLAPGKTAPMTGSEVESAAAETDAMIGDELSSLIPKPARPYSPRVMESLASAVAEVLAAMGVDMEPQPYSGPVEQIGPDEARFLSMIEAAATDYGSPLPVALPEIKGDTELTAITAAIKQLAQDKDFIAFLDEGGEAEEGGEDEMEEEPMDEPSMPVAPAKKAGAKKPAGDDYFASRM